MTELVAGQGLWHLGIREKVLAGFGVVLAILIMVAALGTFSLLRVSGSVDAMNQVLVSTLGVQEIDGTLRDLTWLVQTYSENGDKALLEQIEQQRSVLLKALDAPGTAGQTEAAAGLAVVREKINAFVGGFARTMDLKQQQTSLIKDTFLPLGTDLAARLEVAAAPNSSTDRKLVNSTWRTLQRFLEARQWLQQAIASDDKTTRAAADKALRMLESALPGFEENVAPNIVGGDSLAANLRKFLSVGQSIMALSTQLRDLIETSIRQPGQEARAQLRSFVQAQISATTARATSVSQTVGRSWRTVVGCSAAGLLIGMAAALFIGGGISKSIRRVTAVMVQLAAGDKTISIPHTERRDEVGEIARASLVFKDHLIQAEVLTAATIKEQAARDRRQTAMDAHTRDFGTSVSGVMTSLGQSASAMRAAADEMSEAAKRTRNSTSDAVDGVEASARDLNSIAVATEQMAVSISEISRQVTHVTTTVHNAVDRASETDAKVAGLTTAADRIGDVVRLISNIAAQTNLLALNATIEAARAGDAGKGFAVVASEVKALATETAKATDQIASQIVAIRAATDDAVVAVRAVGLAIGEVETVTSAIATEVDQQAAATQEISRNVQNVTMSTATVADAMEQVSTIAQQTDTASQSVLTAAEDVGQTAGTLRGEVNDFLNSVKLLDGKERRSYERIPGAGATASFSVRGSSEVQAAIKDISRGGAALASDAAFPPGTEARIGLPAGASVLGRIVRCGNGLLVVAFRQDDATLAELDRALGAIIARTHPAAA